MRTTISCALLGLCLSAHAEPIPELIAFEAGGGRGEAVSLKAELRLPKNSAPPYRLIILQHSSGPNVPLTAFRGQTDSVAWAVGQAALQKNYAVVYTDSFTPRGMRESHRIDSKEIGSREIIGDLLPLVRELRKDPRIDKANLFFFGHSLGGAVARDMSYPETWQRARWLSDRPTPFRAVVSSAPGCHLNREGKVGQPLMIIVGDQDDWTPPKPCVGFIESQKSLGSADVELTLVPNVGHTYSSSGTSWNARAVSFRGCVDNPVTLTRDGRFLQAGVPLSPEEYKRKCQTVGATSRGPEDKAPEVAMKTLEFFDKFAGK